MNGRSDEGVKRKKKRGGEKRREEPLKAGGKDDT